MPIRVTKAVTSYGIYYTVGDIIDAPTAHHESLRRLYNWDAVEDGPSPLPELRKAQLVQIAEDRGLDVAGLTKAEIIDLLQ